MFVKLFKKLFSRNETRTVSIKDLYVGQPVEIKFFDPKALGFMNEDRLSYTRFNEEELKGDRIVTGTVEYTDWKQNIGWVLKVSTFQPNNNESRYRSFLFLENEIDYIRILN